MDYKRILPVLFLEYLSISLARSLFPSFIVNAFGGYSYLILGIVETIKGFLSFLCCPLIGRISDNIGRKYCILASMLGTTFPVCLMAFTSNMYLYVTAVAMSGIFAATFSLTFAYISDCVDRDKCAASYGLALATFGLSFTVGPIAGGYLNASFGTEAVFATSCILVVVNTAYILFFLPETISNRKAEDIKSSLQSISNSWNIKETFKIFWADPFLSNLAVIVLFYYTAVWALVSTMMVYVTRHLHLDIVSLGWLLSVYGITTMFSEGILVRLAVPRFGEMGCIRIGLLAYAAQCATIAFASNIQMIFFSLLFSMLANLVYPSVSSLVVKVVGSHEQGEALGALNGVKAMTEGLGPLVFGCLMTLFEHTILPGAPYFLVSWLAIWAFLQTYEIPKDLDISYGKHQYLEESQSLMETSSELSDS